MKKSILSILSPAAIFLSVIALFAFNTTHQENSIHIAGVTQLSAGSGAIVLNGEIVGNIFVPYRTANACSYKEYWYLGEKYIYPSPSNQQSISIQMKKSTPKLNLNQFRQQMKKKFPNGYLIEVTAKEFRKDCKN